LTCIHKPFDLDEIRRVIQGVGNPIYKEK